MACSVISTSQLNQKSGTIVACIQACLFYKKDAAAASFMSLKPFKMSIAESLGDGKPRSSIVKSHSAKVKKGPAKPIPNRSIRTDGYEHWPEFCETKSRCRNPESKGIPKVKCAKCDVRLCFTTNSNCFKKFMSKLSNQNFNQG